MIYNRVVSLGCLWFGAVDTAVKRLSMRETLRGDRRLHRSIPKGCEDGCILL